MPFKAFMAAVVLVSSAVAQAAPTISVAAGGLFSYLPLTLFGGTALTGMGDDTVRNIAVPSFRYAGQSWNSLGVSSNGYLVVGGAGTGDNIATNLLLPDGTAPRNLLAPFWTDLDITLAGAIRLTTLTDSVNTWIVVDWAGVANADGLGGTNDFEAWIGINGVEDISFSYGDVTGGSGGLLTVGAQDGSGTVGAVAYYNGAGTLPTAGSRLRVTTTDLSVTEVPEPASAALVGLALLALASVRARRRG